MRLNLTVQETKQAIADYVNNHQSLNVTVKPEHIDFQIECSDKYGEGDWYVDSISVNLPTEEPCPNQQSSTATLKKPSRIKASTP